MMIRSIVSLLAVYLLGSAVAQEQQDTRSLTTSPRLTVTSTSAGSGVQGFGGALAGFGGSGGLPFPNFFGDKTFNGLKVIDQCPSKTLFPTRTHAPYSPFVKDITSLEGHLCTRDLTCFGGQEVWCFCHKGYFKQKCSCEKDGVFSCQAQPNMCNDLCRGSISGTVLQDEDNDNDGDSGIPGVLIQLKDAKGAIVQTTLTDSSGNYKFDDVIIGSYTVMEVNNPGFIDVTDSDAGNPNTIAVVIGGDKPADSTGNVFIDEPLRSVSGSVTTDNNNDNTGDVGQPGVVVELRDPAGTVVQTTLTDSTGAFSFPTVAPGSYTVVIQVPTGFIPVSPTTLTVDVSTGNITGSTFVIEPLRTISGTVTTDNNNDNTGDAGQPGVVVELRDPSGTVVQTTLTDSAGSFTFTGVPPGTFTVNVQVPTGFIPVSSTTITVDVSTGDSTGSIQVVIEPLRTITGNVTIDNNNDDTGDAGQPGILVELRDPSGTVVQTTLTDSSGSFTFTGVPPGIFTVVIPQLPEGFIPVSPTSIPVDVSTGDSTVTPPLVIEPLRTITGNVTIDGNNDDTGDAGQPGVLVQLQDPSGTVVQTTLTDSSGSFTFVVPPGMFTVVIPQLPEGFIPVSPTSIPVDVSTGDSTVTPPLVIEPLRTITGNVTIDGNNDDTGDAGQPGILVELRDPSGTVVQTTLTDSNGMFSFVVPPGMFTVVIPQLPEGFIPVSPTSIPVDASTGDSTVTPPLVIEPLRTISGNITIDTNNDNIGDVGQPGVVVELRDPSGTVVQTTLTDSNGMFSFVVPPGMYTVVVQVPEGFISVPPASIPVDASSGDVITPPLVTEPLRKIVGQVKKDKDNNDSGDIPLAGVTVQLKSTDGTILATVATSEDGTFTFENLAPGMYDVMEVQPAQLLDVGDSDNGNPNIIRVDLSTGDVTGIMFINEPFRTISGTVTEDTNNDGVGDRGIPGVLIELFGSDSSLVATTLTDSNGNFSFTVAPGTYRLVETNPPNALDVGDSDNGTPNEINVDVNAGDSTGNMFIEEFPKSISGVVREDVDETGTGDAGIPNVFIQVTTPTGTVVGTTLTDTNGAFSFVVEPGVFNIIQTTPDGFVDVTDSDTPPNANGPNVVTVDVSSVNVTGVEFVDERPSNAPSTSAAPSVSPSASPSFSVAPSAEPSDSPSVSIAPSASPSSEPSSSPSDFPTFIKVGSCGFSYIIRLFFGAPRTITSFSFQARKESEGVCRSDFGARSGYFNFTRADANPEQFITADMILSATKTPNPDGTISAVGGSLPLGVKLTLAGVPGAMTGVIINPPHLVFSKIIKIDIDQSYFVTCTCDRDGTVNIQDFNLRFDLDANRMKIFDNCDTNTRSPDGKTWTFVWNKQFDCNEDPGIKMKTYNRALRAHNL